MRKMAASESAPSLYVAHDPLKARDTTLPKYLTPLESDAPNIVEEGPMTLSWKSLLFHLASVNSAVLRLRGRAAPLCYEKSFFTFVSY